MSKIFTRENQMLSNDAVRTVSFYPYLPQAKYKQISMPSMQSKRNRRKAKQTKAASKAPIFTKFGRKHAGRLNTGSLF